jgi:hypothetical protein
MTAAAVEAVNTNPVAHAAAIPAMSKIGRKI